VLLNEGVTSLDEKGSLGEGREDWPALRDREPPASGNKRIRKRGSRGSGAAFGGSQRASRKKRRRKRSREGGGVHTSKKITVTSSGAA